MKLVSDRAVWRTGSGGLIGIWDTTTIANTRYRLRVVVLTRGDELVAEVETCECEVHSHRNFNASAQTANPPLVTRSPDTSTQRRLTVFSPAGQH